MVIRKSLEENWRRVTSQVGDAQLIAVSKNKPIQDIQILYEQGQYHFGENRVQELLEKSQKIQKNDLIWHFIGHLQSNKVKNLLSCPGLGHIHSVDSLKILKEIYKQADHFQGDELKLFFQFNTSGEEQKHGLTSYDEIIEALAFCGENENSRLIPYGLMTMATFRTDDYREEAKRCFRTLREISEQIKDELDLSLKLSMGMSRDYKIAIDEGSDFVRVGSTIFGQRS